MADRERIYVSCSRVDKGRIVALVRQLPEYDIGTVDVAETKRWKEDMEARMSASSGVVFLARQESATSEYCLQELQHANELGLPILPVRMTADPFPLPVEVAQLQFLDGTRDDPAALAMAIRAWRSHGPGEAATAAAEPRTPPGTGAVVRITRDWGLTDARTEDLWVTDVMQSLLLAARHDHRPNDPPHVSFRSLLL